jgi:hypothetical protein
MPLERTRMSYLSNFLQVVTTLRHYATSLKVAGSISDIIGFFN